MAKSTASFGSKAEYVTEFIKRLGLVGTIAALSDLVGVILNLITDDYPLQQRVNKVQKYLLQHFLSSGLVPLSLLLIRSF